MEMTKKLDFYLLLLTAILCGVFIAVVSLFYSNLVIGGYSFIIWVRLMFGLPSAKSTLFIRKTFWFSVVSIVVSWLVFLKY